MADLKKGTQIKTETLKTVTVIEKIGEGGQGQVYKVDYDGEIKALKWYFVRSLRNANEFYANLKENIIAGSPSINFLWPEDITEWKDNTFGYVMDLRPDEYKDFCLFMLAKERFATTKALISAAINIVSAFRELHNRGYSYQDLNDGNFFINPKNGDVLVCDNDNVAPYGENFGVDGKSRYMAPEIVIGKKKPDIHTDRYSLSLILFLLFFNDHPLEGKYTMVPCLTEELEKKFFGSDPIFMFDPNGKNSPVRGINKNPIALWPLYPQYIKDLFLRAFSKEVLEGTKPRIIEKEWLETLIKLRDNIITCSCGEETFISKNDISNCIICGRKIDKILSMNIGRYEIPLVPGNKIYTCHIEDNCDNHTTPEGLIVESKKNPGNFGLKNLSNNSWYASDNEGKKKQVNNKEILKLKDDIKININGQLANICYMEV